MGRFQASDGEVCSFGDDTQYYPTEGCPPTEADARLIAAAPDLLEALHAVLVWIDAVGAEVKRRDTETLAPARAAIAKAEGR